MIFVHSFRPKSEVGPHKRGAVCSIPFSGVGEAVGDPRFCMKAYVFSVWRGEEEGGGNCRTLPVAGH